MEPRKSKRHKTKTVPYKKSSTAVHVMPGPDRPGGDNYPRPDRPGTYSRDLKMRPAREPGLTKLVYNARFATPEDYELVRSAAATLGESMNLFIVTAALERAKQPALGSFTSDGPISSSF